MYKLELDLYSEHEAEMNPDFMFETLKEALSFMKICIKNGYGVIIKEV